MRIAFIGQKGIGIGEKGGGVETHVTMLATLLAERGHEVTAYARPKYQTARAPEGVRLRLIPTIYRKNLEAIVHSFLCTLDALFRRYDIIHYHGVGPATLSFLPRLLRPDMRVVVTFHSQDRFHAKWGSFAKTYLHFGEWAACTFPHATIAVSHAIQVEAREAYHRQAVYIPNGATLEIVKADDQVKRFGLTDGKYLLNVSRFVPHKGQLLLVKAFQALKARGGAGGMTLVLVGAPSYTDDYWKEVHAAADGDTDIRFLGFQSGEALRQLFAHAYLFVLPSSSEGLSVTVLESMSFGTPVLVSDIPENLETIRRAGFSFRNGDAADLADKLGELVRHPPLVAQAGAQVRETVRRHFSWPAIVEQTEALYRSVRH
jgi:glycosyltransferase involved in cell wall biosynthesis